ncbi:MAG: DUF3501 family protein [Parvibaculum sp.]|nr:DUF3501 family protein [Parvibaculum sp.]MBO6634320.1 DUF3501 family protein [Parvibaculum sp.]MBO6677573.1 DUF3501 family protein [Parvibaculum sp.]MBO6685918.1 DUF3501 family protein [Parvibaculum sp.]MBO6904960.1 DUF3501 family protein [Parvibaculum sp.]
MPAMKKEITPDDILPYETYAKERKERRAAITALKKNRRVEVGPYATFYFENYDTMFQQIQEMLHIEKGGAEQLADELHAYNPLIPQGNELVATVMFEINDEVRRDKFLRSITWVEKHLFIDVGGERIQGEAEMDVERTKADGKTSSVHFVHFRFTDDQIAKFRDPETQVMVVIAHENYHHMTVMQPQVKEALAKDFA